MTKITIDKRKIYFLKLTRDITEARNVKGPYKKRPWATPISSPRLLGRNTILYIGRKIRNLLTLFTPNIKNDKKPSR